MVAMGTVKHEPSVHPAVKWEGEDKDHLYMNELPAYSHIAAWMYATYGVPSISGGLQVLASKCSQQDY